MSHMILPTHPCCSLTWYSAAMCVSSIRPLYLGSNLTKFSCCQNTLWQIGESVISGGFLWLAHAPQIANNEYSISKKAFLVPNAIRGAKSLSKILILLNTFELSKWLWRLSRKTPSTSATYIQSGIFMCKLTSDETSQNHTHLSKEMRNLFIFSKGSIFRSNQFCLYYWKISIYKRLEVFLPVIGK